MATWKAGQAGYRGAMDRKAHASIDDAKAACLADLVKSGFGTEITWGRTQPGFNGTGEMAHGQVVGSSIMYWVRTK